MYRSKKRRWGEEGELFEPGAFEENFGPRKNHEESPDLSEGKVKAVLRDGYKLHDRVIRPAQVVVSKGSEQGESIAS